MSRSGWFLGSVTFILLLLPVLSLVFPATWPVALLAELWLDLTILLAAWSGVVWALRKPLVGLVSVTGALVVGAVWLGAVLPGVGPEESLRSSIRMGVFNPSLNREPVRNALREARDRELDVQLLVEANPAIVNEINSRSKDWFPHAVHHLDGRYGMAVLSREPLTSTRLIQFPEAPFPILEFEMTVDGQSIRTWGIHPATPATPGLLDGRNQFFRVLRRRMKDPDGPDLLVGDFNATSSSPVFQSLVSDPKWRWRGNPLRFTWPTWLHGPGVRIDHVLYRPPVGINQLEVGPDLGSDHFPLYVSVGRSDRSVGPDS